jgi:hypothetical protein
MKNFWLDRKKKRVPVYPKTLWQYVQKVLQKRKAK